VLSSTLNYERSVPQMEHRDSTESTQTVENSRLAIAGACFSFRINFTGKGVAERRPLPIPAFAAGISGVATGYLRNSRRQASRGMALSR
jgi:hypothetical protein